MYRLELYYDYWRQLKQQKHVLQKTIPMMNFLETCVFKLSLTVDHTSSP